MKTASSQRSALRRDLADLLRRAPKEEAWEHLSRLSPSLVLGALRSLFLSPEELVAWRAQSAWGRRVAEIFEGDPEAARVAVRQLMWTLNDESGGIGWGAPSAMAEAMVYSRPLTEEYGRILLSYITEGGNWLEYPPLRFQALWGAARLSEKRPEAMRRFGARERILPFLRDPAPECRVLSALALGMVGLPQDAGALLGLEGDEGEVSIYWGWDFYPMSPASAARSSRTMLST